jgi:hypothetical protein
MPDKPLAEEAKDVGQDKPLKDFTERYDAEVGTYKDNIDTVPVADRLPTAQMPKAPDPNPFTLGPMSSGGR